MSTDGTAAPGFAAPTEGRTARKRRAITDAALALFLRNGYRDTSMDQVAADAGVSKQTVYKHFADKERLFTDIVLGVTGNAEQILTELGDIVDARPVGSLPQLQEVLRALARAYLDAVLAPHVLALRRLVVAEADRFPDLASHYYQQAPTRGIDLIETAVRRWVDQGLLTAPDARLAAAQFAYLALGPAQDHVLFCPSEPAREEDRDRFAAAAATTFVAAYQNPDAPATA